MTELTTIDTANYSDMARMMGLDVGTTKKRTNTLNRFRLWNQPIMGQVEVNGKMTNAEVIEGGMYRLEVVGEDSSEFFYSKEVTLRPFLQRFMLSRYVSHSNVGEGKPKGEFHRTVMAEHLKTDLKDNKGKWKCGKPVKGYMEDFQSLPSDMQSLIRQIKRVRVVFGILTMEKPLNNKGEIVDRIETPIIWEISTNQAFNIIGKNFDFFKEEKSFPLKYNILLSSPTKHDMDNGNSYYTPISKVNTDTIHNISKEDEKTFSNFIDWIKNYNDYVCKEWDKHNSDKREELSHEDKETVEEFIEIDENIK